MATSSKTRDDAAPGRRRRWRWYVLIVLAALCAAAALTLHLVLGSDLPRIWALAAIEDATGLRADAATLSVRWGGTTTVRDLALALPDREAPFLTAPLLELEHTSVAGALLTRRVAVRRVALSNARLQIEQGDDGRWDLQRVLALLDPAAADTTPRGGMTALPVVSVTNARVQVVRPDRPALTIEPITFEGQPVDKLLWSCRLNAGGRLELDGRVVPGAAWAHEVRAETADLSDVAALWTDAIEGPLQARLRWKGTWHDDRLSGRLVVQSLAAGPLQAEGSIDIDAGAAGIGVRFVELALADARLGPRTLRVEGGVLNVRGPALEGLGVRVAWQDVLAEIDGTFDTARRRGEANVRWEGSHQGADLHHGGSVQVEASVPGTGRCTVSAHVATDGRAGTAQWTARLEIAAAGLSWDALNIRLVAPQLTISNGPRTLDLHPMAAGVALRHPKLTLTDLAVPGARIAEARADYELTTGRWEAVLEAGIEPLAALLPVNEARVLARAAGNADVIDDATVRFEHEQGDVTMHGSYDHHRRTPLHAEFEARHRFPDSSARAPSRVPGARRVDLSGRATGAVRPLRLEIDGTLATEGATWAGRSFGDLTIPLRADVDAAQVRARAGPFAMLDGEWQVSADWHHDRPLAELTATCRRLQLRQLIEWAQWPLSADGLVDADLAIDLPRDATHGLQVQGSWEVCELRGRHTLTDQASGAIAMRDGILRLHDVRLEGGGGRILAEATFDVRDRRHVAVNATATGWPLRLGGSADAQAATDERGEAGSPTAQCRLDAEARLNLDLTQSPLHLDGTLTARGDVTHRGADVGHLSADCRLTGRTIAAETIGGRLLDGAVSGHAILPLDDPLAVRGALDWADVDLARVDRHFPHLAGTSGRADMALAAAASTDPHPMGPTALTLSIAPRAAQIRSLAFGGAELQAFVGGDGGPVLHQSRVDIAGGTASIWLKLSRHGDGTYAYVKLGLEDLDLDAIVRSVRPDGQAPVGRLGGQLALAGYLDGPHRLVGRGTLRLDDSDLGNVAAVAQILGMLGGTSQTPQGHGTVQLSLDGERLHVRRLDYYNSPLHVTGSAMLSALGRAPDSPIKGFVVGTIRPLKASELAMFDKVDAALTALHNDVAAVAIGGTLRQTDVHAVPLDSARRTIRGLLTGQEEP